MTTDLERLRNDLEIIRNIFVTLQDHKFTPKTFEQLVQEIQFFFKHQGYPFCHIFGEVAAKLDEDIQEQEEELIYQQKIKEVL